MLNKKGQSEDVFEYILVSIALVIGIVVLTLGHNYHEFSIQSALQKISPEITEIQSYDSTFLATDLKNILDLKVSNENTFAELISGMPDNSNSGLIKEYFNGVLGCEEELFNVINAQLDPVFSDNWIITVYDGDERIFFCTPIFFDYAPISTTKMTLPSTNPNKNLEVVLEVYE